MGRFEIGRRSLRHMGDMRPGVGPDVLEAWIVCG